MQNIHGQVFHGGDGVPALNVRLRTQSSGYNQVPFLVSLACINLSLRTHLQFDKQDLYVLISITYEKTWFLHMQK